MMAVPGQSLKEAKRRKREAKKRKRGLAQNTVTQPQAQRSLNDMEEIHLKRRVLDPSSELLLTWWDEAKNQQEGLLISCKCNTNNCTSSLSATLSAPVGSSASNSNDDSSVLVREKLNIRSPPYVSNMLDTSYSGVALYNEANGISSSSSLTAGGSSDRRNDKWQVKRPYPCDYCVKSFRTLYEKRRHESIHTGYRPWKCTECSKAFVARASLRNHMKKRHPGHKPFECAFCDINLFTAAARTRHEQTHRRMKAEKMEMMMRREMAAEAVKSGAAAAAPSVTTAVDQIGERLSQQLAETSMELLEVGNGVIGEDPMLDTDGTNGGVPDPQGAHGGVQNEGGLDEDAEDMGDDVFNITVIPETVTEAEADAK